MITLLSKGFLASLLSLFLTPIIAYGNIPDTLVANPDGPPSSISNQQLASILTLKKTTWPNKQRIQIYLYHEDSEAFSLFIVEQLGLFPYQLRRHWQRASFSGRASSPVIIDNMDELVEIIATTPGAIGFIPHTMISAELKRVEISQ